MAGSPDTREVMDLRLSDMRCDRRPTAGRSGRPALRFLCLLLCTAVLVPGSGCVAPAPFPAVDRTSVAAMNPAEVRAAFAAKMPERYRLANSAVFHIRGRAMTGVGYVAVNRPEQSFALACMNPLGIKLFDISATNDVIACTLAIPDIPHKDAFARVVAADIRDIYLDLVPAEQAEARKTRDSIIFAQSADGGRVEHIFAGAEGMLVEKRLGSRRRIRYYDYMEKDGSYYPKGIVLDNRKYRYRLVLRLKQVL